MNLIQKLVKKFGKFSRQKNGEELVFKCPECSREKFSINPKKVVFQCFRCGYAGRLHDLPDDWYLGPGTARSKPEDYLKEVKLNQDEIGVDDHWMPLEFGAFEPFTDPAELPDRFSKYLASKGLDYKVIFRYRFGLFKSWHLRGRLIIPIIEKGKAVSYLARSIDTDLPKEISGPNKSQYLWNLDSIPNGVEKIVVVEGVFDCLWVESAGLFCVAVMGSHLSDVQIGKLLSKKPKEICLMFDGDDAGRKGTLDALRRLVERQAIVKVRQAPEGRDPDEMTLDEIRDWVS